MVGRGCVCRWLVVLLALGSPSGCRPKHAATGGRVPLRFSGYTGNPVETRVMGELVREFNASQSDIEVTYEPIPGQYYPKLLAMLVSRTAPDVFYLDVLWFKPFLAKKKILLSLMPFLAKSTTKKEDFIATLVDAFSDQGTTYGVPKDFNALALFYNKDMFDAAGVPYPDESWDLERLREAARKLTKAGGPYGLVLNHDRVDRYMPIANAYGAELFSADGRCALASPEGVRALAFYTDLLLKDRSAIYPSEVGATYAEDAFGRRMAAMALAGSWMLGYLAESSPDVRYGVAELPRGPRSRSNFLFTVSYSIPQSSGHPAEAWRLIQFLTSEGSQARITWALPSRREASRRYVATHPEYAPVLRGAAYARPFEFGPKGNRVEARLGVALQQVVLGVRSSAQALREACEEIDHMTGL
jgi:multiple sugar transport system substrate-binding protein